jgi:hypothetical protein
MHRAYRKDWALWKKLLLNSLELKNI